jgi:threonine/homoserine/homoserine lactone efflux protein
MFGIEHFWLFVLSGILLNLTPGQDSMYILGRSSAQGRRAGMAAALGIGAGTVVHTLAAGFGLSFILVNSAVAFDIVKYAGAAYLFFLGMRMLLNRARQEGETPPDAGSPATHFGTGMITNILNPKVALFFLSFLPQFIAPGQLYGPLPFLLLGLTFVLTGTCWCIVLALFAARFSASMRRKPSIKRWLEKSSGLVYLLLGARVALQER